MKRITYEVPAEDMTAARKRIASFWGFNDALVGQASNPFNVKTAEPLFRAYLEGLQLGQYPTKKI